MKKHDPILTLANGREGVRRYRTDYWTNLRSRDPNKYYHPGFPKLEDGSVKGVMHEVALGNISKAACFDRVKGEYLWTVKRGPKVPGTRLYVPIIEHGQA